MPTCFCTARGCRDSNGTDPSTGEPVGRTISYNAWKSHSLDEKALEAETQAQQAEADQINLLSYFLAANTLNDNVSGPSAILGGRFWGNNSSELDTPLDNSSCSHSTHFDQPRRNDQWHFTQENGSPLKPPPPQTRPLKPKLSPHRSRESELLDCLSTLQNEIHHFVQEVDSNLQGLSRPSSKGPPTPFPLHALIDKSSTFYERLDVITFKGPAIISLKESIKVELREATEKLQDAQNIWNTRLSKIKRFKTPSHGLFFDAAHHYKPILPGVDPVLHITLFMTIACEIVLGVSRRGCAFLLQMIQYIINLTILRTGPCISQNDQRLLSDIPSDVRRAEAQFHLKPNCIIVAVCPNQDCHATYAPTFDNHSPIPMYPKTCTHRQLKGAQPCGAELLKPRCIQGQTVYFPIKTFVKNDFKDWLAGLLSRSGFEQKMDAAWEQLRQPHNINDGVMSDIFDGDVLRNFRGSDGQHFSMGGEEGRYVFSLCVDYFNPLGNKQAGKKKSVGMISLVCLNLPPDMRYKPENMFLFGIIPGPQEPPLACLNHYLKFLVDDFLEFWSPGVRFSRTSQFYYGRVVCCALVCLVCDLLGARKTVGFAGVRHNQICALCHCTRQHHGYGNTNIHSWQRRTNQEYRDSARRYQDAISQQERAEIVAETGIRWSELLRLPYFDPSRFVVVDAMHNLFLGLVQEHFEILGIKLDQKEDEAVAVDITIRPDLLAALDAAPKKSMTRLLRILRSPLKANLRDRSRYEDCLKKIQGCHLSTLVAACTSLNILPSVSQATRNKTKFNKMDYAKALLSWRLSEPENSSDASTFRKGCILSEEEVETIRADIANMVTPSWLTSVPHDLGEPRHGKLKADQWRTLATIYLPVSLMRMWDKLDEDKAQSSPRHQKLLDATFALISAVIIATSRSTSRLKADLYLQHMQSYLHLIHELIPDYDFRPNHHMALHLAEYLRLFGPINAWWTFPFERLIGMLQRVSTNFKIGELEQTMMVSFAKSANLRALLLKDICPPAIRNCQHYFAKLINPDIRNSILIDSSLFLADLENDPLEYDPPPESGGNVVVSESTHKALRIRFANAMPQILRKRTFYVHNGRTFSTVSRHRGNSSVLVKSSNGSLIPAQIEEILQISSTEVVFAVRHYRKANIQDPFLKYPFLHISLWSTSQGNIVIIHLEDIVSHFANISFALNANEHLAVVSLSHEY